MDAVEEKEPLSKLELKELKKQKNIMKKKYKKAIKKSEYDTIQEYLTFIKKYDEIVETQKYEKYFNMMDNKTKEIINLREQINNLKDFDTSIYSIFSEKLTLQMKEHINKYTERRLIQIKKQLVAVKKQRIKKERTRAIVRVKKGLD